MDNLTNSTIILLQSCVEAAWVLLPLGPAILCFLIFPKDTFNINGPFSGLSIRATGAFAAYFILFLATIPLINQLNDNFKTLFRRSWVVTGSIILRDEAGRDVPFNKTVDDLEVKLSPNIVSMDGVKRFRIVIPEIDGDIPNITLRYLNYGAADIDLKDPDPKQIIKEDKNLRQFSIKSPIYITKEKCNSLFEGNISCE